MKKKVVAVFFLLTLFALSYFIIWPNGMTYIYLKNFHENYDSLEMILRVDGKLVIQQNVNQDFIVPTYQDRYEIDLDKNKKYNIELTIAQLDYVEAKEVLIKGGQHVIITVSSMGEVAINVLDKKPPCVRCPDFKEVYLE